MLERISTSLLIAVCITLTINVFLCIFRLEGAHRYERVNMVMSTKKILDIGLAAVFAASAFPLSWGLLAIQDRFLEKGTVEVPRRIETDHFPTVPARSYQPAISPSKKTSSTP